MSCKVHQVRSPSPVAQLGRERPPRKDNSLDLLIFSFFFFFSSQRRPCELSGKKCQVAAYRLRSVLPTYVPG